ncbi:hypothetical protein [Bradyrhizobium sp. USDA 4353]
MLENSTLFQGDIGACPRRAATERRENRPLIRSERLPRRSTNATIQANAQRAGRVMADRKAPRRGRKPPDGEKKQFLTNMDPEVIRRIKAAAALRDRTASSLLEEAAKEWLERHPDGKK